jgi:3-hydroxy acid dehydrogenase/malonic semialdehyde reductase
MENTRPRVVWITGASAGIGYALSEIFAFHNDVVIASARTASKLKGLQRKISDIQGNCETISCDVQDETSVLKAAEKILANYGKVDVLINNAGVTYFKDFKETTAEEFNNIIDTNLRGPFFSTKAVIPSMLESRQGLIMNIISYVTKEVYTKSAAYTASKAGLEAMMNVLRAEIRRQGINIVNIYPGAVLTTMWEQKHIEKYGNQMLTANQIAEMVYHISIQQPSLMVEEIVLRPQGGNLQI